MMKKEFTTMSVSQQAEALKRILEEEAVCLARETGFIERERAISGADFAQALILGWLQRPDERVEGFVQQLERREVSISASGRECALYPSSSHLSATETGTALGIADASRGRRCSSLTPVWGSPRRG